MATEGRELQHSPENCCNLVQFLFLWKLFFSTTILVEQKLTFNPTYINWVNWNSILIYIYMYFCWQLYLYFLGCLVLRAWQRLCEILFSDCEVTDCIAACGESFLGSYGWRRGSGKYWGPNQLERGGSCIMLPTMNKKVAARLYQMGEQPPWEGRRHTIICQINQVLSYG